MFLHCPTSFVYKKSNFRLPKSDFKFSTEKIPVYVHMYVLHVRFFIINIRLIFFSFLLCDVVVKNSGKKKILVRRHMRTVPVIAICITLQT